jgi:hypothetical protein
MSTVSNLYELLPVIYRVRDSAQGRPLEALLRVVGEQVGVVEDALDQLYDDQFIETCAEWVTPYIGDLIGYRALHGVVPRVGSPRAEVANTIAYRRRKGTASMLEQLARDVTGWEARVVEFFEWVGWTQYMNHRRTAPPRGGTLSVRDAAACDRVRHACGAFDTSAHTADVRRIATGAGRYGTRNIGIFLWRVHAYHLRRSDARRIAKGRFTFNPVGLDAPLFNTPRRESEISHLAEEINVPDPLRRRVVYDELEARRSPLLSGAPAESRYFADPPFEVTLDGAAVPPEEIAICNLETWSPAPAKSTYTRADGSTVVRPISVAVDPHLGRLTLPPGQANPQVNVRYAYGFSHDMGGGPYDRLDSVAPALLDVDFQIAVSRDVPPVADEVCATLREAIDAWNGRVASSARPPSGIIAVLDSHTYRENLTGAARIEIPAGARLLIAAGDWPEEDVPGVPGAKQRVRGRLSAENVRPHIRGNIAAIGTPSSGEAAPGSLTLNGLLIEGEVTVLAGNLGRLELTHCTVLPGLDSVTVNAGADRDRQNARLTVAVDHSICGALTCAPPVPAVRVRDSILTTGLEPEPGGAVLTAIGADATVEASTVFGTVRIESISASNTIFTGRVEADRRQIGCFRFSYAPLESLVPRRYRCQPDLEIESRIDPLERSASAPLTAIERSAIQSGTAAEIRPVFTAVRYGLPGFAQLGTQCPVQLRTGADDEAEMGAFHELYQPQREANLRVRLDEYLRVGLEAGLFYVS